MFIFAINCFLCDKTVTGTDQKLTAKGIAGIVNFSKKRNDDKWHMLENMGPGANIFLHEKCQKDRNAPPALPNILKMIFCSCTKGCSADCSCRKVGIFCNNVCVYKGGCLNSESVEDEDEEILRFFKN